MRPARWRRAFQGCVSSGYLLGIAPSPLGERVGVRAFGVWPTLRQIRRRSLTPALSPRGEGEREEALDHARGSTTNGGRGPVFFAVIGGGGNASSPAVIVKLCSSEYHGPFTSASGAA